MQELIGHFYLIKYLVKSVYSFIFCYLLFLDYHQTERCKGKEGYDIDGILLKRQRKKKKKKEHALCVCLFVRFFV